MARFKQGHDIANRILLSLPQATFDKLEPLLELRETTKGDVIYRVDQPIEYVCFVNRGMISLVKTMQDGRTVEIGAVGIEGVIDPHSLLGIDRAILESVVQIPGTVLRIKRDALRECAADDPVLAGIIDNYTQFAVKQIAQTAACNRLHSLEERCCRWLLMANDNALSDVFPLTHDFLAMMLGVRRSGVSITANVLQKAGLIRYRRGLVTITNRTGLEDAACECYETMRVELNKLFGPQGKI